MASFNDKNGKTWLVEFDAFNLDDLRNELKIDLADLAGSGYQTISTDAISLVKALAVLCRDALAADSVTERAFSKALNDGKTQEAALEAVMGAASCFFPPKQWSAIQSSLERLDQIREGNQGVKLLEEARPLMEALKRLPPEMRKQIAAEEGMDASTSDQLEAFLSVTDQEETPSTLAIDSPEKLESVPAA